MDALGPGPAHGPASRKRPTLTHLSIFVKDTALVEAAAVAVDFDARILGAVAREFQRAADAGLNTADDSSIVDIDRILPRNDG